MNSFQIVVWNLKAFVLSQGLLHVVNMPTVLTCAMQAEALCRLAGWLAGWLAGRPAGWRQRGEKTEGRRSERRAPAIFHAALGHSPVAAQSRDASSGTRALPRMGQHLVAELGPTFLYDGPRYSQQKAGEDVSSG